MEEWEMYLKLGTMVLGAMGFGKILEVLIKSLLDKRLRNAEEKKLHVEAESQILDNWRQWSQRQDEKIKELEVKLDTVSAENLALMKQIEILQEKMNKLLEENRQLKIQLKNQKQ